MEAAEEDGRLSRKKFILIINKTTIWTPFERRRGLKWQIKRINRVRQLRNFITEEMLSHKLVQNIPLTTTLYQPHHICRFLDVSIFSPSVPVPYCLIASNCNYTFPDFYTKLANTILTAMHILYVSSSGQIVMWQDSMLSRISCTILFLTQWKWVYRSKFING